MTQSTGEIPTPTVYIHGWTYYWKAKSIWMTRYTDGAHFWNTYLRHAKRSHYVSWKDNLKNTGQVHTWQGEHWQDWLHDKTPAQIEAFRHFINGYRLRPNYTSTDELTESFL